MRLTSWCALHPESITLRGFSLDSSGSAVSKKGTLDSIWTPLLWSPYETNGVKSAAVSEVIAQLAIEADEDPE